jgi:ElaB/YqjD/DUF883 family membrane-anchored ribosome-binding protein
MKPTNRITSAQVILWGNLPAIHGNNLKLRVETAPENSACGLVLSSTPHGSGIIFGYFNVIKTIARTGANEPLKIKPMDTRSGEEKVKRTAEDVADNLREVGEEAKNRMSEIWDVSKERAANYAKVTDQKIRDNPYQTIGIAFGIGLLIGVLINRRGD